MKKLLALALFVSVGTAQAQERIELKEVMITASAAGQENYKTGRSVEIISGEELNSLPVNSVDEMLRFVSGMNINSRGANGVQSDIGMRGSTFSQVLILIDNVRLNDPLTAHFNSNLPVSMSEIDHIEITRGPASVSFGGDAVGGVINIITKTYCQNPGNEKLELVGNVNSGENHLRSTDVGAVVRRGKLSISASARTSSAFGEEMNNPNFEQGIAEDSLYHNDFDLRTYTASASYRFTNKLRVYARVGIDDRDFNAKYFYTRSAYDESREKTKNLWTQFSMIYGGDRHQIELNGGYKELEDYFEFNPLFAANEHTTKQTILNFSHRMQLNLPASFTYGVQVLNKSITSTDRGNHEDTNGGFYILYSQTFVKNLHFNASARAEYNEKFGVEILPQASLSYRKDKWLVRGSYGRSIRAADYTERFVSYNIEQLSPGRNAGNPDLQAEVSNTMDFGIDLFLRNGFNLNSTFFIRQSEDLIDFSLRNADDITNLSNLVAGEDYFYADNISQSQVIGFECKLQKSIISGQDLNIDAQLGYTFLETSSDAGLLSKYISNHPKNNVNATIWIGYKSIKLSANAIYISRQGETSETISAEIPEDYFIANARLSLDLIDGFSVYGQVSNFTDTKYEEILGAKLPGRWMALGIKWWIHNK